ncbi:hypothetical protein SAMN02745180_00952 [Sporanaerobacter acetigenes DSM 13106]|uniref:Uncharacterized protein n=1 Tax=Sporanaerobacter acetigenes DSM 13106 TaxID=1123281 RepID=A0A1M5VLP8_9FIRM|nr:hypothetical protein SAMN02745180_00952 [Sporanaerobacter acetigenes DSM 13106]
MTQKLALDLQLIMIVEIKKYNNGKAGRHGRSVNSNSWEIKRRTT